MLSGTVATAVVWASRHSMAQLDSRVSGVNYPMVSISRGSQLGNQRTGVAFRVAKNLNNALLSSVFVTVSPSFSWRVFS
jgi:hypothetical protein